VIIVGGPVIFLLLLLAFKPVRMIVGWLLFAMLCIGLYACAQMPPAHAQSQYDAECRPLPMPGYMMVPQDPSADCLRSQAAQRYQAQQAQRARDAEAARAQAQAQALENARVAAEQQAMRAAADRIRAVEEAQADAEQSPDNWCRDPKVAGMLISSYNGLSWGYPAREAVDIEHLVTIRNDNGVLSCHGVFVHTNEIRIEGTLTFRPNVAGDVIEHWTQGSWSPPVRSASTPEN
jgi:hypothetical protein